MNHKKLWIEKGTKWPFRANDAPKVKPSSKAKPTFKDLKSSNPTNTFIPLDPPISSSSNQNNEKKENMSVKVHTVEALWVRND